MVDYARFYLDPRADASRNMTALARAAQYRELMGAEQEKRAAAQQQQMFGNQQDLAKFGADLQKQQDLQGQRSVENQLSKERLGVDKDTEARAKEKMGREIMEQQFGFIAQGLDAVEDAESYASYRDILKQMVDAKLIPESFYEGTPEEYDKDGVKKARRAVKAMLGQEVWEEATTDSEGRLRQKTMSGEEKVLSEGTKSKWKPDMKSYLDPATNKVHTLDVTKDSERIGEGWIPLPSDYGKPEMKESEARQKILKAKEVLKRIESTGGMDPMAMVMMEKLAPGFAEQFIENNDVEGFRKATAQHIRYLEGFIKKTQSDTDDPAGLRDMLKDLN